MRRPCYSAAGDLSGGLQLARTGPNIDNFVKRPTSALRFICYLDFCDLINIFKAVRCPAGIENFITNTGLDPLSNAFFIVGSIVFC
jgi:hypothetical protein